LGLFLRVAAVAMETHSVRNKKVVRVYKIICTLSTPPETNKNITLIGWLDDHFFNYNASQYADNVAMSSFNSPFYYA